ncbi:MAG: TonB-dependent receptor [Prolixibacteraceae bacterium]|jgi:hypothetical protein|nr:TonB-dependent receptor [Prolixibacteraceae bacterium]MBT6004440.1 TonB-dependent receptor [Prolixibacteraceae bacterium]MBT6763053.1 TonB-dependent receptor [Prolixibacteraceae bacterium]MBT6998700.1 TonB-dependent receptor [Prolixibacteraceae bacterium]MBT7397501.1 TonB-dependent receptor [Prolixibacteraceae bacterium]
MKRFGIISIIKSQRNNISFKLIILFTIHFGFINSSFSQTPLLDKELKFKEHTTTVKIFLEELRNSGGFSFSFGQDVPLEKGVQISAEKQNVRKHLEHIFKGDSLKFVEQGNKILIIPFTPRPFKNIPKQTIRGRIIDLDSKLPLINVNIVLDSVAPLTGTITNENGYFKFEKVPIGRHNLRFSCIGYGPKSISNILVASGKEYVVMVEMEESVVNLSEVKIPFSNNKSKPINNLAMVSGRSFSANEIENFPGSMSDISRTALSFPGVVSTNDGKNHIVIRGNSPKGLQWRLEGIEIPNLNHFADIGASGGGVSVISNNMIAGSDFLTSAFPAEYGNALSGVFDLRLRNGNNEKHEKTIQVSLIGSEIMVEGPLKKNTNTTYIAQYRYSTLRLFQRLGVPLLSVPDFQDLSFKIYHPTKKTGVFSVFGIGGLSHETGESGYIMNSNMTTIGISNSYTLNPKTFVKSVISFSGWKYSWDEEYNMGTEETPINRVWNTNVRDYTAKVSISINKKFNTKHKIKAGIIYEMAFNNSYIGWFSDTLFNWYSNPDNPDYGNKNYEFSYVDSKKNAATLQTYLNWKYRINDALTLNSGIHFLQFYLNNNYSIEPRFGVQWKAHPRHILSGGFGVHSRKESMTLYSGKITLHDGAVIQPNLDLELTKAKHYVIGYNFLISDFLHLKAEAYYQSLYDIPAYPFPPYFSTINSDYGFEGNILTNYGTAYNKGIELTLEKFISNGYYFLINGTLYESKFKNKPGIELHTRYDGTYASNGLFGKEFKVGKGKQNILSASTRYILAGGIRHLPIDKEQSLAQGRQVRIWDNGYTEKASDYFRIDLQLKFTQNKPKYTSEWHIDIINVTNRKNMLKEYWDNSINDFKKEYQNPLIPMLTYRIRF